MKRILVTDDNPAVRAAIVSSLQQAKQYHIEEANDGDEAINMMTEQEFDLVTLDLNMPNTGGWEALRIIKDEDNGWDNTKVVILTISKDPESVLKAWNLGASYYMTKPFSTGQLHRIIEQALIKVP